MEIRKWIELSLAADVSRLDLSSVDVSQEARDSGACAEFAFIDKLDSLMDSFIVRSDLQWMTTLSNDVIFFVNPDSKCKSFKVTGAPLYALREAFNKKKRGIP